MKQRRPSYAKHLNIIRNQALDSGRNQLALAAVFYGVFDHFPRRFSQRRLTKCRGDVIHFEAVAAKGVRGGRVAPHHKR